MADVRGEDLRWLTITHSVEDGRMAPMIEPEQPVVRLPFPHRRNDCEMCREWDATVEVTDQPRPRFAQAPTPPQRRRVLCPTCLGKYLSMLVHDVNDLSDDVTVEVTLALAPGRRADHP